MYQALPGFEQATPRTAVKHLSKTHHTRNNKQNSQLDSYARSKVTVIETLICYSVNSWQKGNYCTSFQGPVGRGGAGILDFHYESTNFHAITYTFYLHSTLFKTNFILHNLLLLIAVSVTYL